MFNARSDSNFITGKRLLKVMIFLITAGAFLFNTVCYDYGMLCASLVDAKNAWAAGGAMELSRVSSNGSGGPGSSRGDLDLNKFSIPVRLGEIKGVFRGTNGKVIIHIADAHCIYSAQHAIAGIIRSLADDYNIGTVFMEGGSGDYDLSMFTRIEDPSVRNKVSDYFVREGVVNGAEWFAINNPDRVRLFGAEDEKLYFENLKAYRDSLEFKKEADGYLNQLSAVMANLKLKIYPAAMKELDDKIGEYREGRRDFKAHAQYLESRAKSYGIDMSELKHLGRLMTLLTDEKAIDFKKCEEERSSLLDKMKSILPKRELREIKDLALKCKEGRLSTEAFYSHLFRKASSASVDLAHFPNLVKYSAYLKKYESIDKAALLKEISGLEEKLMRTYARTDDERRLHHLDRILSITKNIFNTQLVKSEFDYYNSRKEDFESDNFTRFFRKVSPLYGVKYVEDPDMGRLDLYRPQMEKFYNYSLKRDDAFLKNVESELEAKGGRTAVFVTGGFHSENLSRLFAEKGYSYIEVLPIFDSGRAENPYFRLLAGQETDMAEFMQKAISAVPQTSAL
ncbi:MAG: hypothetical protein HZA72_01640 [Candidatus Omnitrophica bacterium]|nr:hypothetical protein [Candidatus Omnitrophota bacterium]